MTENGTTTKELDRAVQIERFYKDAHKIDACDEMAKEIAKLQGEPEGWRKIKDFYEGQNWTDVVRAMALRIARLEDKQRWLNGTRN